MANRECEDTRDSLRGFHNDVIGSADPGLGDSAVFLSETQDVTRLGCHCPEASGANFF